MRVIRAEVMGMCFGVRDALEVDRRDRRAAGGDDPRPARPQRGRAGDSQRGASRCGARPTAGATLPETPAVLITAHGISDRERRRLEAAGKRLDRHDLPAGRRASTRRRRRSRRRAITSW